MPINASYEYFEAEKKYLQAQTLDEKIVGLEEMIKAAPKHKGSENLLAELKTRLKKFREKAEKNKSTGKGKKGIRKEGFQAVIVGLTNIGKSSLLANITNAKPFVSESMFSTSEPEIGTMDYQGVKAQVIDVPAVEGKDFDVGLVNNADCLLLLVNSLSDLDKINPKISRASGKRIIVWTKIDLLSKEGLRKLEASLRSKRINFVLVSNITKDGVEDLKKKIFESMQVIRVFTKEPGKEKNKMPVVLTEGSVVRDVAESIYKGFSSKIKESRLTGPSAKFANQKVGLNHKLKDLDVVEFHSK